MQSAMMHCGKCSVQYRSNIEFRHSKLVVHGCSKCGSSDVSPYLSITTPNKEQLESRVVELERKVDELWERL